MIRCFALQKRIAALEQQIEKEKAAPRPMPKKGTVSVETLAREAAEKAVAAPSSQVGAQYQGTVPSEPTHDLLREADQKIDKLQEQVKVFEFHGYFCPGFGLNGSKPNSAQRQQREA